MSIKLKLSLLLVVGFGILVSILHFVFVPKWLATEHDLFIKTQRSVVQVLEPYLTRHILSGDYAALYATLDELHKDRSEIWRSIRVHLDDGQMVYPLEVPVVHGIDNGREIVVEEIRSLDGEKLATVFLVTDWTKMRKQALMQIWELEYVLLLMFALIFIAEYLLQSRFIARPLKRLQNAALQLSRGDFYVKLPIASNDEIGSLTRAFGRMQRNLLQSYKHLQQAACEAGMAEQSLKEKQVALEAEHARVNLALSQVSSKNTELLEAKRDLEESHGQLLQAEKLASVGQLAAGIAHEINTPIQFVGDNTRFLQEAFDDLIELVGVYETVGKAAGRGAVPGELVECAQAKSEEVEVDYLAEEVPRAISQTLEGVDRVTQIVRSMKDFSHPGSEQQDIIDINQAIDSTITVSRNEWKYDAELLTEFDPRLTAVPCYQGEFNQVVLNIIVNAAHAIKEARGEKGEKGVITIETRLVDEAAEIRIGDTGTGMPESVRRRIFEPFYTTKGVGKGSGQGLAIAYSVVVERHGGSIDVETEPGRGTTFILRLPMEMPHADVAGDMDGGIGDDEAHSVCG